MSFRRYKKRILEKCRRLVRLSKKEKLVIRLMLCVSMMEMIFGFLILDSYFQFARVPRAVATELYKNQRLATDQLALELRDRGFSPVISQKIIKKEFSVDGVLLALSGDDDRVDNIQIFEYPDPESAMREFSRNKGKILRISARHINYLL